MTKKLQAEEAKFAKNQAAAAAKLALPESMIKHLADLGAAGFKPNGSINLDDLRAWIKDNPDALKSMKLDGAIERALLVRARRERVEFDNSIQRGQHIHIDEIKRTCTRYVGGMKARLMAGEANVIAAMKAECGITDAQAAALRKIWASECRESCAAMERGEWFKP